MGAVTWGWEAFRGAGENVNVGDGVAVSEGLVYRLRLSLYVIPRGKPSNCSIERRGDKPS